MHDLRLTALRFAVLLALATTGLLISCLSKNENTAPTSFASASIINTAGQPIGTADFTQESTGIVTMVVSVTGYRPGQNRCSIPMAPPSSSMPTPTTNLLTPRAIAADELPSAY